MSIDTSPPPLELIDAVEQVIVNPSGRHHWRRLNIVYDKNTNHTHRLWVKNIITNKVSSQDAAGFLRETFLAYTCDDQSFLPSASINLLLNALDQPDKVMTYINYEIGRIMSSPINRSDFQNAILQEKIPELISGLAKHFLKLISPIPSHQTIKGNIAIYASNICSAMHPPTKLVLQHARLLHDLGYSVQIFCAQEEQIDYAGEYLGNGGICVSKPFDPREFRDYLGDRKISFSFANKDYSLQTRWKSIVHLLHSFQPELIFFIGMHSPLIEVFYQSYPVLALSTTSIPPIASCDLWLSANEVRPQLNTPAWGETFTLGKSFFYPYRIERRSVNQTITRQQLNIADSNIVLVTVGARLQSEINGVWAQQIKALLRQYPTTVWFLIGGDGALPPALEDIPKQQIKCMPNTPDLMAIYRCCDIYLNPPRLGGGFSVAEAMAEQVPVVSYNDSDGGNKLGSYAVKDLNEYLLLAKKLIDDHVYRKELGQKMAEIFNTSIDLHQASTSLDHAVKQCLIQFNERDTVSQSISH